ncbi:MAG: ComF family protein [Deltaproteobacteria bacterium]|nr:ComF family protein [Deltaproteobacteria bacterium]
MFSLFFPHRCLACRQPMEGKETLCSGCYSRISFIPPDFSFKEEKGLQCGRSVSFLEGILLDLVHRWKYKGEERLGTFFVSLLERTTVDFSDRERVDLILPIPLSPRRLRLRGFNQSFVLARGLAGLLQAPVDPLLLWRRDGIKTQVGLSREERRTNLQEAFFVPPKKRSKLRNKRILLVDDVLTTGSTLSEAAHLLKREGAASVSFITLARRRAILG